MPWCLCLGLGLDFGLGFGRGFAFGLGCFNFGRPLGKNISLSARGLGEKVGRGCWMVRACERIEKNI